MQIRSRRHRLLVGLRCIAGMLSAPPKTALYEMHVGEGRDRCYASQSELDAKPPLWPSPGHHKYFARPSSLHPASNTICNHYRRNSVVLQAVGGQKLYSGQIFDDCVGCDLPISNHFRSQQIDRPDACSCVTFPLWHRRAVHDDLPLQQATLVQQSRRQPRLCVLWRLRPVARLHACSGNLGLGR